MLYRVTNNKTSFVMYISVRDDTSKFKEIAREILINFLSSISYTGFKITQIIMSIDEDHKEITIQTDSYKIIYNVKECNKNYILIEESKH